MTDRRREREEQGTRVPKPDVSRPAERPDDTEFSASTPISPSSPSSSSATADPERDRRVRRARFLADLAEARELRRRVAPRRARAAELHARVLRTFRY